MPHLYANGHSRMIFEHFWDYLHLKDSMNGFPQLFQLYSHITLGHMSLE